ncbi:MAG: dynamin family protein [Desulfobacterales bacterium]|jgi:GTPase SAR1 family protein
MSRDTFIDSLRAELLELVETYLTPVALHYGYSEVPLESNIKWRPLVLVLGNYSSGKSTLINDFLGTRIQKTGQAPTDDSFTVITYGDGQEPEQADTATIIEERDGKFLLNDPEYPFEALKKHGQRFAAHFRLKKVHSPFLEHLALIDTPGMLDSITERDRGYNYQEVIGDLAQMADLVLILFDPHKAGTVRETHTSLRDTLPAKTFEDRVLFVLNRIDECASLIDLLQVYGTLCWNLSQMTGRKDIPPIHLNYSPSAKSHQDGELGKDAGFLQYLEQQRYDLKQAVLQAPRFRLDNLASFVETHSERLAHFLEGMASYGKRRSAFRIKVSLLGFLLGLAVGGGLAFWLATQGIMPLDPILISAALLGAGVGVMGVWNLTVGHWLQKRFHARQLRDIDRLTPLGNQTRRDSWEAVKGLVQRNLESTGGRFSLKQVKAEHLSVSRVHDQGSQDIREAINDIAGSGDNLPEWAAVGSTAP